MDLSPTAYDIYFIQTSAACPEQYEAYDDTPDDGSQVGYLRLRHGRFEVCLGDHNGPTIFEVSFPRDRLTEPEEATIADQANYSDGAFENHDIRDVYLAIAARKIRERLPIESGV